MAEKLDSKEMVTQKELIYSNMMQIEAKQSRIGLWSQNNPIEPWKYRRTSK
jgi:endonuclease YncB( thermonuclease family)